MAKTHSDASRKERSRTIRWVVAVFFVTLVVSGSASATIAALILTHVDAVWPRAVSLSMSALVAGLTVGGKAIGKTIAVNSCTQIVHLVGRVLHTLGRPGKKKSLR